MAGKEKQEELRVGSETKFHCPEAEGAFWHSKEKGFILIFYKISCPYKITLPFSM